MSEAFPKAGVFAKGYTPQLVDDFFEDARRAYEGGVPAEQFSSDQVRQATFTLKRGGYDIEAVDAAMSRLEAAFVQRDRADHIAVNGENAWNERVAERATTLYPRLLRPHGDRFAHPEHGSGYNADEVDDLLDQLAAFFDDNHQITAEEIRGAVFRSSKGAKAYKEGPVDAYLGRVVEILLAVS